MKSRSEAYNLQYAGRMLQSIWFSGWLWLEAKTNTGHPDHSNFNRGMLFARTIEHARDIATPMLTLLVGEIAWVGGSNDRRRDGGTIFRKNNLDPVFGQILDEVSKQWPKIRNYHSHYLDQWEVDRVADLVDLIVMKFVVNVVDVYLKEGGDLDRWD